MRYEDLSNEVAIAASQFVKEREYWLKKLAGNLVKSSFPIDKKRKMINRSTSDSVSFMIPPDLYSHLLKISRGADPLLFVILGSGLGILLHKYTGNRDIIFGIPINRQAMEGEFINTVLPLRIQVNPGGTFRELLIQVKECVIEAIEHQNYPLDALCDELNMAYASLENDFSLFDVSILLENIHEKDYLKPVQPNVILAFMRREASITGLLEYNSSLYERTTMEQIITHYLKLLTVFLGDVEAKISEVDLLSEQEIQDLVFDFNAVESDYPKHKTLHELFADQVGKTPDNIAVVGRGDNGGARAITSVSLDSVSLTYRKLNEKSNRLAKFLRKKDVKADTIVGIMIDRSIELIIGMLGILKAGGAFLPIELQTPKNRITILLEDSQAAILLTTFTATDDRSVRIAREISWELVLMEAVEDVKVNEKEENEVTAGHQSTSLAYIIFTSGSTGKPRGVLVEHRSVVNYICWAAKNYIKNETLHFPLFTPISFDLTITSVFTPLITGNGVVVYGEDDKSLLLGKILVEDRVGVVKLTPSHLKLMVETYKKDRNTESNIKRLIVGGEELETLLTRNIYQNFNGKIEIFNEYGPTETTVGCMIHRYEPGNDNRVSVPIGKPADNMKIYILDKTKKPVPMGIVGEIYISGVGVARGYLNNPELTAEKFIKNLALTTGKMYRTGDLGRWLPGKNIEFLGRIDEQVKIRGYRIEIEEIKNVLTHHAAVKEAAVVAVENYSGEKRLVAYIVPDTEHAATVNHLLHLEKKGILSGQYVHEVANIMPFISINQNETEFLYKEIFENQLYVNHGITLAEGACVFDVGAHIGMFSIFLGQILKDVEIYAFEPIPLLYNILGLNTELYGAKCKCYSCGLGSFGGETVFTYYPNATVLSGRFPNTVEEIKIIKRYIHNQEEHGDSDDSKFSEEQIDQLLAERLSKKEYICAVNTLSHFIRVNKIEKIDLLKMAVEKSEIDVLKGIDETDWPKIKQIVVEVYDTDGRLEQITQQLERHGYLVKVERSRIFHQEKNYHLYACQPRDNEIIPPGSSGQKKYPFEKVFHDRWYSPKQLKVELQNHLQKNLPDYMVPSTLVLISELPLTPNGKIDKKVLPSPETVTMEKYVPPRNEKEKRLIDIWADVLGVNKQGIGIDSNFFELGGDSIKSIQVASRLQKYNMRIDIKDLFDNPTIRELARYIKEKDRKIDQDLITGQVHLTPIQIWFFDNFKDNWHCNQSVMLYSRYGFKEEIVKKVFQEIVKHHDALRMIFKFNEDEVIQHNREMEGELFDFEIVNLESCSPIEAESRIESEANRIQRGIDLTMGPLVKMALFRTNEGDHLLMVIHHLVVDGVSWRILLEDFAVGYQQVLSGDKIKFQDKTDSYQEWAQQLIEYAQTQEPLKELSYWRDVVLTETPPLPNDYEEDNEATPRKKVGSYRETLSVTISQPETSSFLKEANHAYTTQALDLLLTALGLTIKQWIGSPRLLINLEGHGREHVIKGVDITRTVGWFTSQFPILVEMNAAHDLSNCIIAVKESLRKIPNNGIGYGILRYLVSDETTQGSCFKKEPEIGFNYLGQVGQEFHRENIHHNITISKMKMGDPINPYNMMNRALSIDGSVKEGELCLEFYYDGARYMKSTIEKLAEGLKKNLLDILQHCLSKKEKKLTPSDIIEDVKLSSEEIEDIQQFIDIQVE